MDRRDFLKKGTIAAVGVAVGSSLLGGLMAAKAPASGKVVGLQLYSLREAMKSDPVATLKAVAAMGYTTLESADYKDGKIYGYTPKEFRKLVEGMGMKLVSAHINPGVSLDDEAKLMEWWGKAFDDHKAAGCTYVVQPWLNMPTDAQGAQQYADYFNKVGALASKKGIKFGFHNHAQEFAEIDGQPFFDYLIENTNPKNVLLEMDVYWVKKGGKDPVDYLEKYPGRFPILHIKDESIIGDTGEIDFKSIYDAAYKQGLKGYFVEVERYTDTPEKCVKVSYNYLMNADYVK